MEETGVQGDIDNGIIYATLADSNTGITYNFEVDMATSTMTVERDFGGDELDYTFPITLGSPTVIATEYEYDSLNNYITVKSDYNNGVQDTQTYTATYD